MSSLNERPWDEPSDFDRMVRKHKTWTAVAKAYTERGYSTSRDTMRRVGERHGIFPPEMSKADEAALKARIKRLEKTVRDTSKDAQEQVKTAQVEAEKAAARPRNAEPLELLAAQKTVEKLQVQLANERKLNKAGVRESNLLDEVRELLQPVIDEYQLPPVTPPKDIGPPSNTPVSMGMVWCDQHWGKVVDPITVHGLNNYNPTILAMRYEEGIDKFRKLRRLWANEHPVDELVIILNGDPVNNDHSLHPHDAADSCRVSKQVLDCALVTAQGIHDLAHDFPLIRVICCGSDNHGRGNARKPAVGKAGIEDSWTSLYHEQVASLLMNVDHVEFEHSPSYQALFMIKGRSCASAHGHHLQGGGGSLGIPAYAMKRHMDATVAKTVAILKSTNWTKLKTTEDFVAAVSGIVDHVFLSHFHSRQILDFGAGDVRLAPSMVGTDTYVYNALGKMARAGILAFVVHPKHGIIADHLLDLQSVMEEGDCRYSWGALEDGTTAATLMKEWLQEQKAS